MKKSGLARRGSALIVCAVALTVLVGVSGAYLATTELQLRGSTLSFEGESAVQLADAGLSMAMDEIFKNDDVDGDGGVGSVSHGLGRGTISVVAVDNGDGTWNITSTGVVGDARRTIEAVVARTPGTPLVGQGIAAVVARGNIPLLGNIQIDGRDFSATDVTDTPVDPQGVLGIFDQGAITSSGANTVGGNGVDPYHAKTGAGYEAGGVADQGGTFADVTDDDGDGAIDEEAWDGVDNDGDGRVDEDVNSFPSGPDAYFKQPAGTLKTAAQAQGTYFATQSDFDAWKVANVSAGNLPIPGGSIVYLEFDMWGPPSNLNTMPNPMDPAAIPQGVIDATLARHPGLAGADMQTLSMQAVLDQPGSILVQHNATSSAQMKNLHGYFKGALMGDQMDHFNANTEVRGTIVSFGTEMGGNAFGNGTAQLRFSSQALGDLPAVGNPSVSLRSWRQVVTTGM